MEIVEIEREAEKMIHQRFNIHTLIKHIQETFRPINVVKRLSRGRGGEDWGFYCTLEMGYASIELHIRYYKLIPNNYDHIGNPRFKNIFVTETTITVLRENKPSENRVNPILKISEKKSISSNNTHFFRNVEYPNTTKDGCINLHKHLSHSIRALNGVSAVYYNKHNKSLDLYNVPIDFLKDFDYALFCSFANIGRKTYSELLVVLRSLGLKKENIKYKN